ncbi:hypothetical protein [Bifidobacterium felsineum]|uniref:hypothetical protein n=1 Tax=Bifidobacterium felsineum TaxID=2045440 RepID=UPI001BDC6D83|nr:hypothetical protein [Bifidobacterium felsineum]MBT1164639.1 hypothetical protein [Bifidobacterium felsineum]
MTVDMRTVDLLAENDWHALVENDRITGIEAWSPMGVYLNINIPENSTVKDTVMAHALAFDPDDYVAGVIPEPTPDMDDLYEDAIAVHRMLRNLADKLAKEA